MSGKTRIALVTGGSGAIGRVVATRLAADGMTVVVHYAGNPAPAEEVAKEIADAGGSAVTVQADITEPQPVRDLFDTVEQQFGGIDVVVNTAGIMILKPVAELDVDDLDRMQRVNVRGAFLVSQQAARRLRPGGALINIATTVRKLALPTYAAYAASKAAIEALTPILAKELRGRDVTVNAVAPGPTATPFFFRGKTQEVIDQMAKSAPLERLGEPGDAAEVVAFLAGPARWVNGQTVFVNGGVI
ncbi:MULTISPECIES: SDR family oxidoreductase [Catenuloplanes]|uniref:3-oxoacyl-[acyl-carrier protein] reductase n=1 Tax=Catenuloplanes niger TaxID=587534 RepID=A0AAE3ZIE9_9ACTN|nr:SDR family oxidoreductase [Catenuloplanes niger]MDR7320527.1 3-oxoacyl-[acyl-carrier protein] reductase [Catenuloplanes niger]